MEDSYELFKRSDQLKIYYFIGRLNPPHPGHIDALIQMISMANADNSVALIILGSGPKKERTMDNPIPYETKEAFLRYILPPQLKYAIVQMTSQLANIDQWYKSVLAHIPPPSSVSFIRFAGDKGDNSTKLQFIDVHLIKKNPYSTSSSIAIPPLMANASTEMSATRVRKLAYKAHLDQLQTGINGYEVFNTAYGGFYREFTRNIYQDIIMPALEASPEQIDAYIKTSKLPSKAKPKTEKKSKSKSKTAKKSKTSKYRANASRANSNESNEESDASNEKNA
jgi:nicotinamide mononucleotide adenylyltransferase